MAKLLSTNTSAPTLCYRVRAAMDMPQREFADEIGTIQKTISNWEGGGRMRAPSRKMLELLAKQYKVPL